MKLHAAALVSVLAIIALGQLQRDNAAPIEVLWGAMGAGGGVYSFVALMRRWDAERYRREMQLNGAVALITQPHVVLRGIGCGSELLILISGLSSMATPPSIRPELVLNDLITAVCLIGLAALSTFAAWYAEQTAERQLHYLLMHPEG